ncbi:MAG TPA: AraC family transcriptional regulator [Candidatus Faecimorpha stercoravium]|nr:AraC family transcriptional regulator [Candidatus Faecimorpha stercoravium]
MSCIMIAEKADRGVAGVTAYRFTEKTIQMPHTEHPYLYIVLDGALRLHTPSGILDYMAGQYSLSKIDTPLWGQVLFFSSRDDFLALALEFSIHDVITVALGLDRDLISGIVSETLSEQMMSAADQQVLQAAYRLLYSMHHQTGSEYLRKSILREVIYYLLCGSSSKSLLQSCANIGQVHDIYEANQWIKENFRQPFTVEELAEQTNMSVSLFHQKFKSAVGMGPLQCQKRLRLTEARRLMMDEGKNVSEASMEVGYESLSQFIRDYRKMFAQAPKEDIRTIQKQLQK